MGNGCDRLYLPETQERKFWVCFFFFTLNVLNGKCKMQQCFSFTVFVFNRMSYKVDIFISIKNVLLGLRRKYKGRMHMKLCCKENKGVKIEE